MKRTLGALLVALMLSNGMAFGALAEEGVALPLTNEPVTLTVFQPMNATLTGLANTVNDLLVYQELERRTGVKLDFVTPTMGQEATAYNLMIASGQLPDIIFNNGSTAAYPDGIDAAIDDGYFLDLTDLVPIYAPNYNKVRTSSDFLQKASVTDAGRIGAVYQIPSERQGTFIGLQIREDWLDELGLDMPVTYDDWENVLTQFKEVKGLAAPMMLGYQGYNAYDNNLSAGYGVSSTFYQVDGQVKYGPAEEGWRDYVTTLNRWYEKGLIDPDYMTGAGLLPDMSLITTGQTGAWTSLYTMPALYESQMAEENARVTAVAAPKVNAEDTVKIRANDFQIGVYMTISADCEYPELALQWLDYLYTEEGALLCNYGIEGDTFTLVDGEPVYTEKMLQNPDGLSFSQAMALYTMPPSSVCWQDWKRELGAVPAKDILSYDIWGATTADNTIPTGVTLTSAENQEYAKIMSDITALVNEKTNLFITGVESLDNYDAFVAQIEALKIDRAVELQQAALDRFYSR